MSASDTDLEKQKQHHRGPLAGIVFAVAVGLLCFLAWFFWAYANGQSPQGSRTMINDQTGQVEHIGKPVDPSVNPQQPVQRALDQQNPPTDAKSTGN